MFPFLSISLEQMLSGSPVAVAIYAAMLVVNVGILLWAMLPQRARPTYPPVPAFRTAAGLPRAYASRGPRLLARHF